MRLRYSLPALADLNAILEFIAARSPQGVRRVQARIQIVVNLLLLHPHIGRRTSDPAIRKVVVTPYPYEATENEIIIHTVRHAARSPSGMPGSP